MILSAGIKQSIDSLPLTNRGAMLRCQHGGKSPERHPKQRGGNSGYDILFVKRKHSEKGGR